MKIKRCQANLFAVASFFIFIRRQPDNEKHVVFRVILVAKAKLPSSWLEVFERYFGFHSATARTTRKRSFRVSLVAYARLDVRVALVVEVKFSKIIKFYSCILLKLVLSYTLHYYGSLDFKLENQRLKALKTLDFR